MIIKSITFFAYAASYAISLNLDDESFDLMMYIIPYVALALILVFVGYFFIKFPYYTAAKLIPNTGLDNSQIDWEEKLIERIGFVLLGVYILSSSFPGLVHDIIYIYQYSSFGDVGNQSLIDSKINAFISLVKLSIGFYLVLGSKGLVKIIHKLRS